MTWNKHQVRVIWSLVNRGKEYDWVTSEKDQEALRDLVPNLQPELFKGDPGVVNRKLREQLSNFLRDGNAPERHALAKWIIARWGRIGTNKPETVTKYIRELGNFEPTAVTTFIGRQGTNGISSWSKMIAFADPANHAIYDSRTAVALNCVLAHIGNMSAFAMPPGRGTNVRAATDRLQQQRRKNDVRGAWLGYEDYITLLKQFVELEAHDAPQDLLAAEMVVFANSDAITSDFCNGAKAPRT